MNPHLCDHRAPSHFGEVRGEEVSRPATQSNIYFGRKYCRKCRQVDVLAPWFHCHHLCTVASAVKVPSYFHNEQGFLEILESFSEPEVGQELYRRPWDYFYSVIMNFIQIFMGCCCERSWEVFTFDICFNVKTNNCTAGHNGLRLFLKKFNFLIKPLFYLCVFCLVKTRKTNGCPARDVREDYCKSDRLCCVCSRSPEGLFNRTQNNIRVRMSDFSFFVVIFLSCQV